MLAEIFISIFLFIGIAVVTAIVFGVWMVVAILRLIFNGLAALFAPSKPVQDYHARYAPRICGNWRCRQQNPSGARFCRRCGAPLRKLAQAA